MRGQASWLIVILLAILALVAGRLMAGAPAGGEAAATVTETVTETVTVTVTSASTGSQPSPWRFVPDRDYYRVASELIRSAGECVCLAVFIAKYDPDDPVDPANDLLRLLAEKAREGVEVRVLVDDVTAERYPETLQLLSSSGAEVRLDPSPRTTMHAKLLIVDRRVVLVGSHNWSEAALSYNWEASVLTGDPRVVESAVEWFEKLWDGGRPAP